MTIELQLIESLKTTISVQADLIAQLKLQIESLKASQIIVNSPGVTNPPIGTQPYQQPWISSPIVPPFPTPWTYTVSGDGQGVALTGDPLPVGSIQSQTGCGSTANIQSIDYAKITNQHHNVYGIGNLTDPSKTNFATTSNVVSMYDSIIQSTPAPISTEAINGMS